MNRRQRLQGWIVGLVLVAGVALGAAPRTQVGGAAQEAGATPGIGTPVGGAGTPVAVAPLPLGAADLGETRNAVAVAPGVTYTRIARGEPSARDGFTVDVAFLPTLEAANELAGRLTAAGYEPRIEERTDRAPDDPASGSLGFLVRVGEFATNADATAVRDELTAAGFAGGRAVFTGEDGGETSGPWVVHALEIDPALLSGRIAYFLASGIVPGRARLSAIAARTEALAAVNGGYFVVGPTDGTPGDFAGVSVVGGALLSEAVNGRTSLLLPAASGRGARIASVSTAQTARAVDGAVREIDGLNREPGLIRGCGGVGDAPNDRPKHDFTCTDDGELILFAPVFGQITPAGAGVEVALDASRTVTEVRQRRGGEIPVDGAVLSGTSDAAEWLTTHAPVGASIAVDVGVLADGQELPLADVAAIVNGGPRLLRNGQVEITAAAEGFVWEDDPGFYYRFGVRRNPRLLAGVTASANVLLVVVDGRQPGYSLGASFAESARLMQTLGAIDAVNLDGGGSATMTIGDRLANQSSDAAGERPVADAILILPED